MPEHFDAIIIGSGIAGLVAAAELADAGKRTAIIEQEAENSIGGQAFWSLGGLFFVNSPEQRRMGIHDSVDLATQDWMGSAQFDRDEDHWPRKVARAYIEFAAGEMRPWLHQMGMRWFPVVGWAERGGAQAHGHGNSVPRFHVTWGTGPGIVAPFESRVRQHVTAGRITLKCRHRVSELITTNGAATGVSGEILAPTSAQRGQRSNRTRIGSFHFTAGAIIVASGGIGGDQTLVRKNWPTSRLGPAPKVMISGVPHHVDGRMIGITRAAGAATINTDRMWHYTEGIQNWDPIWPQHGIRILPGPSSMWFDASGNRLPAPFLPGHDTLGTLRHILSTGHEYSWFVLTQSIIKKEFALSGSEQNPDLTDKDWLNLIKSRGGHAATAPVEAFKKFGADFVVRDNLRDLVDGMNALTQCLEQRAAVANQPHFANQVAQQSTHLDDPDQQRDANQQNNDPSHITAQQSGSVNTTENFSRQYIPDQYAAAALSPDQAAGNYAQHPPTNGPLLDYEHLLQQITDRDRQLDNPFSKDAQINAIRSARKYLGDKLIRVAKPHKILDPAHGPLIAVRLNILTRKTLGGLHTNLDSQQLDPHGQPMPGLYAIGEAAGFGGGGYHGYNALEGTFLGGCIHTGLQAARHAADAL